MTAQKKDLAVVEALRKQLHEAFPGEQSRARLEQLDAHLDTVAMIISHIHDEAARAAPPGG